MGPWSVDREIQLEGGMSLEQLEELGRQYEQSKRSKQSNEKDEEGEKEEQPVILAAAPAESKKKDKKKKKSTGPPADIPCAVIVDSEKDYLGRSWIEQGPKGVAHVEKCYASKQRVATMPRGHTEGTLLQSFFFLFCSIIGNIVFICGICSYLYYQVLRSFACTRTVACY
jgi:hypothetical protein